MEIPFLIDPDVYDNTQNQFYSGTIGNWNWEDEEIAVTGANTDIKIANELPNPDVELVVSANPQGANPAGQVFTLLERVAGEYAHDPGDYNDLASLDNQNGLVWYVETYDVQNNPPPNANQATVTGVTCDGFVA